MPEGDRLIVFYMYIEFHVIAFDFNVEESVLEVVVLGDGDEVDMIFCFEVGVLMMESADR